MNKRNIRVAIVAIVAILVTLLVTLLIQNSGSVTVSFISMHLQLPLFVVVLLSVLLGWIISLLFGRRK